MLYEVITKYGKGSYSPDYSGAETLAQTMCDAVKIMGINASVITSYSIHYTKLYDCRCLFMSYLDDMLNLAKDAMNKAYAPYSKYNVGAVIRGESGKLYCGCNVENAAYPSGSCAEQAAISAMILGGDIKISDILIISDGKALVSLV